MSATGGAARDRLAYLSRYDELEAVDICHSIVTTIVTSLVAEPAAALQDPLYGRDGAAR